LFVPPERGHIEPGEEVDALVLRDDVVHAPTLDDR
jgi:hypothetical protein